MKTKRMIAATGAIALGLILSACGAAPQGGGVENTPNPTLTTATPALADATSVPTMDMTAMPATDTTTTPATGASTSTTTTPATGTGTSTTTTPAAGAGTSTTTTPATGVTTTPAAGTQGSTSIGGALTADPRLSTLNSLLEQSGLTTLLEALGPVTIFAPTNEAFAALPAGTIESLSSDLTSLQRVLFYHVSPAALPSSAISGSMMVPTLAGQELEVSAVDGMVMVNGSAQVVQADITVGQAVIHVIDEVLIP